MTSRILDHSEWHRVVAVTGDPRLFGFDPKRNDVLVVEHEGQIVGVLALMEALHAECFWVAPEHRGKSSVFRRMKAALWDEAERRNAPTVLAAAIEQPMHGILSKLGEPLIGTHYVLNMGDM